MVVVLAGGTGGAKLARGMLDVVGDELAVVANTADDIEIYGAYVSPDPDLCAFWLADRIDDRGWGLRDDTFHAMDQLRELGVDVWFNLGDRDLAIGLRRAERLREGASLTTAIAELTRALGLAARVLPMSDQPVRTTIRTPDGWLPFQEYFVHRRAQDEVLEIRYDGSETASPAPGLLETIHAAKAIMISPSNPLVSVGTILSLAGVRDALRTTSARIVGVSPIVGGATIKGPADKMMRGLGMEVSAVGVARAYADFLDVLVIDNQDADLAAAVEAEGVKAVVTDTIMRDLDVKRALAQVTLEQAGLR